MNRIAVRKVAREANLGIDYYKYYCSSAEEVARAIAKFVAVSSSSDEL